MEEACALRTCATIGSAALCRILHGQWLGCPVDATQVDATQVDALRQPGKCKAVGFRSGQSSSWERKQVVGRAW